MTLFGDGGEGKFWRGKGKGGGAADDIDWGFWVGALMGCCMVFSRLCDELIKDSSRCILSGLSFLIECMKTVYTAKT